MSEQMEGKIVEHIELLAHQLGVASDYVFALLVKHQIISGALWLGFTVLFFIAITKGLPYLYRLYKKEKDRGYLGQNDFIVAMYYFVVAVLTVTSVILIFGSITSINKLLNPEYYAIKEILNVFKK
jgi:hypothetical protein